MSQRSAEYRYPEGAYLAKVGDVRSGPVKRVAAAAGDGAQVVASIHEFLAREAAAHG